MKMRDRDIYNLLGLSFDAVDMDGTVQAVLDAIAEDRKLFLSTPNLNFLIASLTSENFRNSVLNSDLSVADGMPIVFMCKLLDIPIKERVAGSSLIDELRSNEACIKKPIKVFFFGGQDGIAQKAHDILNREQGGLRSVGYLNPGFGTVTDMSTNEIIDQVNKAAPEFIIVSLGAKKGQAWIESNRTRLKANVISHLGAVVNFIAGNVKRAPRWVQKMHMEWIWRIKEEPALFKRYVNDGTIFLKLMFTKILPYRRIIKNYNVHSTPTIKPDHKNYCIEFKGDLTKDIRSQLQEILEENVESKMDITFNMAGVTYIDQAILGLFLRYCAAKTRSGHKIFIIELSEPIRRIFELNNLNYLI
tara:strand:- start:287149 stop:288228 length:1080 start_codon:yes stop_codon:yes gene_type:complete